MLSYGAHARVRSDHNIKAAAAERIEQLLKAAVDNIVLLPRGSDKYLLGFVHLYGLALIGFEHLIQQRVADLDEVLPRRIVKLLHLAYLTLLRGSGAEHGVIMILLRPCAEAESYCPHRAERRYILCLS